MGLFAGEDVEARPSLWRNPWLLALLAGDLPVDAAVGLIVGLPRLEAAWGQTGLVMPLATGLLIGLGHFLTARWWAVLPPLVLIPFTIAWRWRERAVRGLQVAVAVEVVLFAAICLTILLPIHTLVQSTP